LRGLAAEAQRYATGLGAERAGGRFASRSKNQGVAELLAGEEFAGRLEKALK